MAATLQLILCVVTFIQLTSSQPTYNVIPHENDVSCDRTEEVLRQLSQLRKAVLRLQIDVADIKGSTSKRQRTVAGSRLMIVLITA